MRLGGYAFISLLLKACGIAPTDRPEAIADPTASPTASRPPVATSTTPPEATGAATVATSTTAPSPTPVPSDKPAASPTSVPTATTRRSSIAQIAFVKTQDRTAGVNRALALIDWGDVRGKTLFLKANYNSADPTPGSTHEEVLSTLVRAMQAGGAGRITVGDRSGMGDTRAVMERKGVMRLGEELGFDVIVFDELGSEEWKHVELEDSHWRRGFHLARPAVDADGIIQTCCLKTHRYGGHFTLSLKNSVGLVAKTVPGEATNYMSELHGSPDQRRMIAEINAAYRPDLIVLDGVKAFVDGGPDRGTLVQSQVVLAGTDRVAIDAVGVALLRYYGTTPQVNSGRIWEQEQIARAVDLGLGVSGPEEIELVTDDAESAAYAAEIRQILLRG